MFFFKYDAVGFLLFDLPHCLIHFVSYYFELLINLVKLAVGFGHIQGVACSQRNLEIHISVHIMNINIPVCGDCILRVQAPLLFHFYTNCSLLNASISMQVWLLSSCNLVTINLNRSAFHGFCCLNFQWYLILSLLKDGTNLLCLLLVDDVCFADMIVPVTEIGNWCLHARTKNRILIKITIVIL